MIDSFNIKTTPSQIQQPTILPQASAASQGNFSMNITPASNSAACCSSSITGGSGLVLGPYTLNASQTYKPNNAPTLSLYNGAGSEIVRLNKDGTVTWAEDINVDEAAESFSKAISLGVEMQIGITQSVKLRMRDSVFEDLIEIAKEKGSLTADDLTYLLKASKIIEKLKGSK